MDLLPAADDDDKYAPPMPSLAELEAQLAASEADRAAGRTVPLAPVLARMRAAADRIALARTVAPGVERQPG